MELRRSDFSDMYISIDASINIRNQVCFVKPQTKQQIDVLLNIHTIKTLLFLLNDKEVPENTYIVFEDDIIDFKWISKQALNEQIREYICSDKINHSVKDLVCKMEHFKFQGI